MARKRNRNFKAVRVYSTMALGTLAGNTLVGADMVQAPDQEVYIISGDLNWTWNGCTAAEGPILFGVAHGDLTDAEVEACIEETYQLDRGNIIAQEVGSRPVRIIGAMSGNTAGEADFNDGKPLRSKIHIQAVEATVGLRMWAYNTSSSSLTTGSALGVYGTIYVRYN